MHAIFMISGVRRYVDEFFDWLDCRFWNYPFKNPKLLPIVKDGEGNILKEGFLPITARVRYGIYGTYEICFPEEYKDVFLTTLRFHQQDFYPNITMKGRAKNFLGNMEIATFRKLIGCEPIPEFKTEHSIPIPADVMNNIRIIAVGVRYDVKEWESPNGLIMERI